MPKNQVTDPITDQEIAFARLVLAGGMTDRHAAEAVGLNPDTAAYIKSKPRVRAYMLEHRAAVQQELVERDAELRRRAEEEERRKNQWRQQVLDRLWEIASLPAEATRNSITGQLKALQMIVAMEGLIPDRRAGSAQRNSVPAHQIYPDAWTQQATTVDPQPGPPAAGEEADPGVPEPTPAPNPAGDPPTDPFPSHPTFTNGGAPAEASEPHTPRPVPDTRVPFSIQKNRFGRHR